MKIYIAGPMTGRENFNREAFNKEAERLTRHGHTVLNPASLPDGWSNANTWIFVLPCSVALMRS